MAISKIKERIKFFPRHEVIVLQTKEVEELLAEIDRLTERAEKAEKQLNNITQDGRFSSMFPAFED